MATMKVSVAVTWWFNQNERGPLKVGMVKRNFLANPPYKNPRSAPE